MSQSDVGFLDFDGDGNVTLFTRYLHDGVGWQPDPQPENQTSGCSVFEQDDVFEAYQEEGEVFDLRIDMLSFDPMRLVDDQPWRAEVKGRALLWPGGEATVPTTLVLRR